MSAGRSETAEKIKLHSFNQWVQPLHHKNDDDGNQGHYPPIAYRVGLLICSSMGPHLFQSPLGSSLLSRLERGQVHLPLLLACLLTPLETHHLLPCPFTYMHPSPPHSSCTAQLMLDFIMTPRLYLNRPPKIPIPLGFFPFISNVSLGFILTCFSVHLLHHLEVPQSFITEKRSAQVILWDILI